MDGARSGLRKQVVFSAIAPSKETELLSQPGAGRSVCGHLLVISWPILTGNWHLHLTWTHIKLIKGSASETCPDGRWSWGDLEWKRRRRGWQPRAAPAPVAVTGHNGTRHLPLLVASGGDARQPCRCCLSWWRFLPWRCCLSFYILARN